jgi:hypothetical protein
MRARVRRLRLRTPLGLAALGLGALGWSCSLVLGIDDVPAAPSPVVDAALDTAEADVPSLSNGPGIRPPPRPTMDSNVDGGRPNQRQLAFAIRAFRFGQNDLKDASAHDPNAWKTIGYDIDGVISKSVAIVGSGTCKGAAGAPIDNLEDGELGRDNSFGANLFPIMNGLASGALEQKLREGIDNGTAPTVVLVLNDVSEGRDDTSASATVLLTAVASPPLKPIWDGNDAFKVDQFSLRTTSVTEPKTRFVNGYVSNDTFVAAEFNDVTPQLFFLPMAGVGFVPLSFATLNLTITLDANHEKALLATVVGVIQPKNLEPVLNVIGAKYLGCNTSLASFKTLLEQSADLSIGAHDFLDPTKTCDAISVAMALDLERIQLPVESVPVVSPPLCDAGTD